MVTSPQFEPRQEAEAIQIFQPDAKVGEMKLWRPPAAVIAEAQEAARALKDIIAKSEHPPKRFGEKEHLLHEHLEVLGHFFGYCTKNEWTKYVEYPDGNGGLTRGFEASELLMNERTGQVVGRAEAMCLDEEEMWGEVSEYEWQHGERVEVGTKMKPLFQLRSMAQTRASGKAFRMKLGWVMVLAGYSQTPAEEMNDRTLQHQAAVDELPTELKRKPAESAPAPAQTRQSAPPPITPSYQRPHTQASVRQSTPQSRPAPAPQSERVISEPQARRFYALWRESGKTKAQVKDYLLDTFGIDNDRQIPANKYQAACDWAMRRDR
jgi:hypothetical protein